MAAHSRLNRVRSPGGVQCGRIELSQQLCERSTETDRGERTEAVCGVSDGKRGTADTGHHLVSTYARAKRKSSVKYRAFCCAVS